MTDLLRRAAAYYDASYPPDILGGGGGPGGPSDPHITSLAPNTAEEDTGTVTVNVNGRDFGVASQAEVDGAAQATTFVNSGHVTFGFDTTAGAGTYNVSVRNVDDAESNDVAFTVTAAAEEPEAPPPEEDEAPEDAEA